MDDRRPVGQHLDRPQVEAGRVAAAQVEERHSVIGDRAGFRLAQGSFRPVPVRPVPAAPGSGCAVARRARV